MTVPSSTGMVAVRRYSVSPTEIFTRLFLFAAVGVRRTSFSPTGSVRVYSVSSGANAGDSVPLLTWSAVSLVSVLLQSPPMSAPPFSEYITRISSFAASSPFATVYALKLLLVNQSLSVPIQPAQAAPVPLVRSFTALI